MKIHSTHQQHLSSNTSHPARTTAWLPYLGGVIGIITGMSQRVFTESYQKQQSSGITNHWFLNKINAIKQLEIKNFALAAPFALWTAQTITDAFKDKSNQNFATRLMHAAKKNFTLEQAVYLGTFLAFGLTGTSYCRTLANMCGWGTFDPSGHVMMKTLCATILSKVSTAIAKKQNSAWPDLFNALYTATDAVLIHTTVSSFHTIAESIAGLAWGLGLVAIAEVALKKLRNLQTSPPPIILHPSK